MTLILKIGTFPTLERCVPTFLPGYLFPASEVNKISGKAGASAARLSISDPGLMPLPVLQGSSL